jgi:hypothetical protein
MVIKGWGENGSGRPHGLTRKQPRMRRGNWREPGCLPGGFAATSSPRLTFAGEAREIQEVRDRAQHNYNLVVFEDVMVGVNSVRNHHLPVT